MSCIPSMPAALKVALQMGSPERKHFRSMEACSTRHSTCRTMRERIISTWLLTWSSILWLMCRRKITAPSTDRFLSIPGPQAYLSFSSGTRGWIGCSISRTASKISTPMRSEFSSRLI